MYIYVIYLYHNMYIYVIYIYITICIDVMYIFISQYVHTQNSDFSLIFIFYMLNTNTYYHFNCFIVFYIDVTLCNQLITDI